ncbi:hypothetical protein WA026_007076 [Henosepilachna vigintioctopunctata]|uniref:Uncharacterized protein n=1 Tax=Henosepilachna vigintioctopunctata TaxID=420089 RepID=A0AAW1VCR0_9CUCU
MDNFQFVERFRSVLFPIQVGDRRRPRRKWPAKIERRLCGSRASPNRFNLLLHGGIMPYGLMGLAGSAAGGWDMVQLSPVRNGIGLSHVLTLLKLKENATIGT